LIIGHSPRPGLPATAGHLFRVTSRTRHSPLGGQQGGQGSVFGIAYQPGSLADRVVEAFSGPHDYLKSGFWYNSQGTIRQNISFVGGIFGEALNYANVLVASPFVIGSVALPTNDHPWF